jgi:hypothetical protein
MPSLLSPFRQVGRLVAVQVGRLRAALESLAGEVRAAVARAVGQATGEAVREALRVILDGRPERRGYHESPDDGEGAWGEPRHSTWPAHRASDPYARDPDEPDPDEDPDHAPKPSNASTDVGTPDDEPIAWRRAGAWSRAVAAGCQAAAWWLRRHPGPSALAAGIGIGIAAGVVTLVGNPLVAGVSAVAASALAVLALADAARGAAGLADKSLK